MKNLKKKVCLTGKVNDIVDREFVKYFVGHLRNNDYEVDVFINGQNYDLNTVNSIEKIRQDSHNTFFIVNKQIGRLYRRTNATIYLVNSNNLYQINVLDHKYDMIFQYGYKKSVAQIFSPSYLNIAYTNLGKNVSINKNGTLFFVMSNIDTLVSLTPFINNQYDKKVAVLCNGHKIPEHLFNSDIAFVTEDDFDQVLHTSSVVIGEGPLMAKAILNEKPTIVVGSYGYGGILTQTNLGNHFRHNFSGRIGGTFNETIPFNLLNHDLEGIIKITKSELERLKKTMHQQLIEEYRKVGELFTFLAHLNPSSLKETTLVRNSDYAYAPISPLGGHLVVHATTSKLLYQISKEEYEIINHFESATAVGKIIEKFATDSSTEKKITKNIQHFLNYNILKYVLPS